MDRVIAYPGEIPLVETMLSAFKNAMVNDGFVAVSAFGFTPLLVGFPITPLSNTAVSGSAFAVQIGVGWIGSYQTTDQNAYGVLGTDSGQTMKFGVGQATLGICNTAPPITGQSINYLIYVGFSETDSGSTVLPYYNAADPAMTYAGPANSGEAQNTTRIQRAVFGVVAGTAATTGTQTTPACPSGYVPLAVVTVNNGDSAAVSGQISTPVNAPFSLAQKPFFEVYLPSALTTVNGNSTFVASQSVTFPSFAPTRGFRVKVHGILNGQNVAAGANNFQLTCSDGTNTKTGATKYMAVGSAGQPIGLESVFYFPTVYTPGSTVTFTLNIVAGSGGMNMSAGTGQPVMEIEMTAA
jgi:hypothetical protein